MADHDPLCPGPSLYMTVCECALIARVRADEREQTWRDGDDRLWAATSHEAAVRERIAQEIESASAEFIDRQDRMRDDHKCKACDLGRENYIRATEHAARIARGGAQ
jgi:hypothetical protein